MKVNRCPGIINDNNIDPGHSSEFDSAMPTSVNNSEDQPAYKNLKGLTNIRMKKWNRPIIVQPNINSIRNNFDFLCSEICPNLNLSLVSETKLNNWFSMAQFLISGFCKTYRLDRCSNSVGLLLYIRGDIPSHLLTGYKLNENVEFFFCGK